PINHLSHRREGGFCLVASALIFANGEFEDGPAVRAALEIPSPRLVIAVDGGLRHVLDSGLTPDLVVGDLDSISVPLLETRAPHAEILRFPAHKDETDLELALLAAVNRGWHTIRVLGAIGGRLDQTLGNVWLLALPALQDASFEIDVRLVTAKETIWLARPGRNLIEGKAGDTVSLIPL